MAALEDAPLRRWRISLYTTFPKNTTDLSQGFPQQLEFDSRVSHSATRVGGIVVRLSPSEAQHPEIAHLPLQDVARLEFEVDERGPREAVASATSVIDLVLDDLSFQLQEPLQTFSMQILDVSPPLMIGEQRDFQQLTSYDQYKLSRSVHIGTTQTVLVPKLRTTYSQFPPRLQAALDWYIKAMHSPWDADRYIFLWICVEVLRSAYGRQIEEPVRLRCSHEIAVCPECNKPTSQVRQGASARAYFQTFGLNPSIAADLWDMRQLVHGAKSFTPEKLNRLGELSQILRAAAATGLRSAMGIEENEPPFVGHGAVAVSAVGVGGTRAIGPGDLREM